MFKMCVIIDKNVCHEIVGPKSTPLGTYLRKWLTKRRNKLVIGGQVRRELIKNRRVGRWLAEALSSGVAKRFSDHAIDDLTQQIRLDCESNDSHVIALAHISGARLLFTRDNTLMRDFKNRKILGGSVRGRIYTSDDWRPGLRDSHKLLLRNRDLCETEH